MGRFVDEGETPSALYCMCMASALPVIKSMVKEFLQSRNLQSSTKPSTENVVSDNSALQAIVNQTGIDSLSNLTAILESNFPLGIATPVDLVVNFLILDLCNDLRGMETVCGRTFLHILSHVIILKNKNYNNFNHI